MTSPTPEPGQPTEAAPMFTTRWVPMVLPDAGGDWTPTPPPDEDHDGEWAIVAPEGRPSAPSDTSVLVIDELDEDVARHVCRVHNAAARPEPPVEGALEEDDGVMAVRLRLDAETVDTFDGDVLKRGWSLTSVEDMSEAVATGWYGYQPLAIAALIAAARSGHDGLMLDGHKCRKIASMIMSEGRDWWLGELTEPLADWPQETHCLHITTPLKTLVLGMNHGDWEQLAVLAQIVNDGPLNATWLERMTGTLKARALSPDPEA